MKLALIAIVTIVIISAWGLNIVSLAEEKKTTAQPDTNFDYSGNEVAGWASYNIVFDESFPKSEEKIVVYKDLPQHYTREDIISLGEKFGFSSKDKIKEGTEGFGIMKDDHSMHAYLFNTGSIEYTNTNRAHTINPYDIPGNLPSDEEAIKIATEFLEERDLLPEGAVLSGVTHGKIYTLVRDGEDTVDWEDVQVWYGRVLNGVEVKGTKISIDVGGGGDIIDFYSNWRIYEPYAELPVKSPEEAFEELKSKGVYVGMNSKDSIVSIDEAYLAYHSLPGAYTEEYLEPVWVFKGNVMADGKAVMAVEEYIPALEEVPEL
ncbi:MAG: hypothetical protein JW931_09725 [Methanomicrobiaceae archaeon]|nr:hypothetical protein [Methanomicrobiaceae archaeon]